VGNVRGRGAFSTTCKVDVGDEAPSFTLKDQNGRDVSLSKFKGKPVVLYFYPKDDTPGCTKQACYFRDSYEAYKKAGAEVVGISADPVDSHKAFAEKHNLPFTLLSDENSAVRKEFGIKNDFLGALPGRQTYLLDGSGVVKLVYNNQFMPEKHISETLRVIEQIKPEQTELKDLPKVGLGMIGKIFKNPEQISKGGKKEEELGMIGKIFKNPEQIPRGGKKDEEF
jgi:peroxiredoxin Q/BCP